MFSAARFEAIFRTHLMNSDTFEEAVDETAYLPLDSSVDRQEIIDRVRADMAAVYDEPTLGALVENMHRWYAGPTEDSVVWRRFKNRLLDSGWPEDVVNSIDSTSSQILGRATPPKIGGEPQSGRGLVIGYVQSGKTTSFMSVIAKAVNSGYKIVIVLSGVTNNLREQTQTALNEFLAPADDPTWHWLTTVEQDFTVGAQKAQAALPGQKIKIAVVKKQASRLRSLIRWLKPAAAIIKNMPVLIIDDEADQASINSAKGKNRQTAINKLLIELLDTSLAPVNSYIGYTATPFANLLVDPNQFDDIFPRDFIYALPRGEGYFGPAELFGRAPLTEDDEVTDGLDIIRIIPDDELLELGSAVNPQSDRPAEIPLELQKALDWFIVSTATRLYRANGKAQWSSMLVHTSGRISSHEEMRKLITTHYLKEIRLKSPQVLARLERVWGAESAILGSPELWDQISGHVHRIIDEVEVVTDNSQSPDRLDYGPNVKPKPVIAIGGNTLSRGLVLKGLISSYFIRTSKAYDTLLQMGRWFGYRKGYEDLQRIWMQEQMSQWFRDLALVEQEIRNQIEELKSGEVSPAQLPVLIRDHPSMKATGRVSGVWARIGFSKKRIETILFDASDRKWLEQNFAAGERFVRSVESDQSFEEDSYSNSWIAKNVPVSKVKNFLSEYCYSPSARVFYDEPILKYIDDSVAGGELNLWDVFVFRTQRNEHSKPLSDTVDATLITRSKFKSGVSTANIHHLANVMDISIGIPEQFALEAKALRDEKVTNFDTWLELRDRAGLGKKGLIGLYLVDKDSKAKENSTARTDLKASEHMLGITIFFPKSDRPNAGVNYQGPESLDVAQAGEDDEIQEDVLLDELSEEPENDLPASAEEDGK